MVRELTGYSVKGFVDEAKELGFKIGVRQVNKFLKDQAWVYTTGAGRKRATEQALFQRYLAEEASDVHTEKYGRKSTGVNLYILDSGRDEIMYSLLNEEDYDRWTEEGF